MAFKPAPEPQTPLARYRILSPTADVRVSPLCLGAMNFGTEWVCAVHDQMRISVLTTSRNPGWANVTRIRVSRFWTPSLVCLCCSVIELLTNVFTEAGGNFIGL